MASRGELLFDADQAAKTAGQAAVEGYIKTNSR